MLLFRESIIKLLDEAHEWQHAIKSLDKAQEWQHAINVHNPLPLNKTSCDLWGVVTSIFEPTFAALQFATEVQNSCLVVVGDLKTPHTAWTNAALPDNIVYLDPYNQKVLGFAIFKHLHWNHFGRKNIGFMYAISQGAEWIYDFDDDNTLIDPTRDPLGAIMGTRIQAVRSNTQNFLFNPYPVFHAQTSNAETQFVWPRGFPLNYVKDPGTFNLNFDNATSSSIAVFQSLADHDPDVDAIYRMTRDLPLYFARADTIISVPRGTYAPWNAQAVLVRREAFFGLALPITVSGRVSDIWRSYLTSRLLWEAG